MGKFRCLAIHDAVFSVVEETKIPFTGTDIDIGQEVITLIEQTTPIQRMIADLSENR